MTRIFFTLLRLTTHLPSPTAIPLRSPWFRNTADSPLAKANVILIHWISSTNRNKPESKLPAQSDTYKYVYNVQPVRSSSAVTGGFALWTAVISKHQEKPKGSVLTPSHFSAQNHLAPTAHLESDMSSVTQQEVLLALCSPLGCLFTSWTCSTGQSPMTDLCYFRNEGAIVSSLMHHIFSTK